ncbi:MAG: GNAT family N-acetyltransferase [Gemmatimonadaceae bacterium]
MKKPPGLSPIAPLAPTDQVGAFACGNTEIDDFLKNRARVEQAAHLSQVYVTTNAANEVVAYFTMSPVTVRVEGELLTTLGIGSVPYPSLGGFLLGRLGVHSALQGAGIGAALVMRAAQIAKSEAEVVGGAFLAVDPKTVDASKGERLVQWYADLGFVQLGERTRRMILPFSAVP